MATALDKETQEFMHVDQNDKHTLRSPPKRLESAKVKKVKIDQAPPWQDQFNVTANGGEGGLRLHFHCAMLAHEMVH